MTDEKRDTDEDEGPDSLLRAIARAPTVPVLVTRTPSGRELIAFKPGDIVAQRFRLVRVLGEGGMGVVWAATHLVTRKPVALKFLKPSGVDDAARRQRFSREARAACAVRHPSVIHVHDVLELEDGFPVMVMDLLRGESFAERLLRERTLSLAETAQIMVPVCEAVAAAHSLGIVHRDLKPENIFLAEEHGAIQVKVLDFGIAKLTAADGDAARSGTPTGLGTILGTPYYMAPEQMFGDEVDHRADLWAVGVILYEALAGVRPTEGENLAQIIRIVTTESIVALGHRVPDLPTPILELVSRLLQLSRDARPTDLRDVVEILRAHTTSMSKAFQTPYSKPTVAGETPAPVQGPPLVTTVSTSRWRTPLLVAALALGTVGMIGLAALGRQHSEGERAPAASIMYATSFPDVGPLPAAEPPVVDLVDAWAARSAGASVAATADGKPARAQIHQGRPDVTAANALTAKSDAAAPDLEIDLAKEQRGRPQRPIDDQDPYR